MFYIRLAVCRYVGLLSGQQKSVEKLEVSDLDDTRIRSAESNRAHVVQRDSSDQSAEVTLPCKPEDCRFDAR